MIRGYPDQPSLLPGQELTLRVSTDSPQFRVDVYRCGAELTPVGRSQWHDGQLVPDHLPFQDWSRPGTGLHGEHLPGWPGYPFPIPADWGSAPYVAVLVEGDGTGRPRTRPDVSTPDGRGAKALFVIRNPEPGAARILYKLPLLTYHAYNQVAEHASKGHWSLYTVPEPGELPAPVPPAVSLRRPGGGTGGTPWDMFNVDPFDPTPRQTFVHWDAPFARWLERSGYAVDYCTDLDLHHDTGRDLLGRYRLLLSPGHDEYWTDVMRSHVQDHVRGGGNAAFFSGNTCWWRADFDDEFSFRRVHNWSDTERPENELTGVSFRNGGERDFDEHPVPVGYRVQHADHWVYEGTGLGEGDTFGDRRDEYLIGYECDGAHFDRGRLDRGLPVAPTGGDGTPPNFTILGIGDVSTSGWGHGNKAATMGTYTDGGTVFTAATTDWVRVLAQGATPAVDRITRNVLDRLGSR